MKDPIASLLPLSPAALHIMTAVAGEERHGYAIMQEVARQSDGRYRLGPGTLYENIEKLIGRGLIREVARSSSGDDPRRRYYQLTTFGRRVLSAEVTRLASVLRSAKMRLATSNSGDAS
ncbi:MAG TPA: PadR family transcriptional regulator [Candidatus Aquilonibacter sp.]|nr:PadR family transcriptional regulator [Candidatus Aquilonibacter sp.]